MDHDGADRGYLFGVRAVRRKANGFSGRNATLRGFTATAISGLLGARASMLAELQLADCVIPQDNMVGSVGTGLSHVALHCLDYGRYTVACGCVGLGQACLEQS